MKLLFRRAGRCGLAWLALAQAWADGTPIPVADFARAPQFSEAALSPDGMFLGYIVRQDENSGVGFLNLATMKAEVFWARRDEGYYGTNGVNSFRWVSDERVVIHAYQGMMAINRDGTREKRLPYFSDAIIHNSGRNPKEVLVLNSPVLAGEARFYPEIMRVDMVGGGFRRVQEKRDGVKSWLADAKGNVRFGYLTDGVRARLIYRDGPEQPWGRPIDFGADTKLFGFAGLAADDRTLYIFRPSPAGLKALYAYDVKEGTTTGPLFQHKKYDVESAIFSPQRDRLLGVRYITEGPRQYWFEPELAKLQKELDAAHPDVVNMIVSMDWEMQRLLVFSYSSRESGYYTLLDLGAHKSQVIALTRPWFKAEDLAEMHPVKCAARDGLELNGYLTLPPGHGQKNLPTVVLVHGGPYGVRDAWGFDPLVQFLASRGYAVLQVNYRGSGGYGEAFYDKGRNEIGGAIEDDIVDMTQWAVQHGVADPHRLAVMGASYGGYSTLVALARTPDLFRCGVACMAVSDWIDLYAARADSEDQDAIRFWTARIGDIKDEKQRQHLAAVSPVNLAAQMKAPLFIMHGEEDRNVPIGQAKAMAAALKKAGHPPETLYLEDTGHWFPRDKQGEKFLTKLEAFLATNLKTD
jgi:acetyl esterase/lipase